MDGKSINPYPETVKIVECPRDAWQSLPIHIPAATKAAYLNLLIDAGFRHIDAVSFVSPKAIPQMADSEEVLQLLPSSEDVEIIGIVVNERGADRAIQTGKVTTLGFPYSISPTFLKRNQNQTPGESVATLKDITATAHNAGIGVVTYVSMAFGNPYSDPWSRDRVVEACGHLMQLGIRQISLADTVGLGSPQQIAEVFSAVAKAHPAIEFGVHLHARPEQAAPLIRAAYSAGCRRFDSAIGGLGGCPFAQDDLVGNLPTEVLVSVLNSLGATSSGLNLSDSMLRANQQIAAQFCKVAT